MIEYLEPNISSFFVKGLRNSSLLRATFALNLNILILNLFHSDVAVGSLAINNIPVPGQ